MFFFFESSPGAVPVSAEQARRRFEHANFRERKGLLQRSCFTVVLWFFPFLRKYFFEEILGAFRQIFRGPIFLESA